MHEFELKFLVPMQRLESVAVHLDMDEARRERLRARYFDTSTGLLGKHHLSLRIRKEGRRWVQALKAPGTSAVNRLEHEVARPGRWGVSGPPLDMALHDGTPAGDALLHVLRTNADAVSASVCVVYESDIVRRTRLVQLGAPGQLGSAVVELALDRGLLRAGDRSVEVSELEFELKHGEPTALVEYAGQVQQQHNLWISTISKVARGDLLAKGLDFGEPAKAHSPRLRKKGSSSSLLRHAVSSCLEQVLANASEVACGSRQAEQVWQPPPWQGCPSRGSPAHRFAT